MGLPKSRNAVGLGNSLMNDRFGKGRNSNMHRGNHPEGIVRTSETGETYITNTKKEAAWVKMRSVTEQDALDEFLTTAQLAGTDFTAEKMNSVKIIHTDQRNPYLLSAEDEFKTLQKHKSHRNQLIVPRRPKWDSNTTPQQLDEMERKSFMDWRRRLAYLQEGEDLLMTPFERNLEVWRQLWRVIERSDLVVQIVDARNPLHFRSEDLEKYVKEIDPNKNNLLLINKADMMSDKQRMAWVRYFVREKINFRFFSAELAKEQNELRARLEAEEEGESEDEEGEQSEEETGDDAEDTEGNDTGETKLSDSAFAVPESKEEAHINAVRKHESVLDQSTTLTTNEREQELMRIITTEELESLFLAHAPKHRTAQSSGTGTATSTSSSSSEKSAEQQSQKLDRKIHIGLVGYPNVGKSSTINALIGSKKVSVSATPGKTKHFQTIHLSDQVILCDCPGLVFPNFATTKAELVCNGVLPIDQLREYLGPVGLVASRIPQSFLEAMYGMKIRTRPVEEGGTGNPTASEILRSYARARGFATTGLGQPDESRAARYILKDYVKGRLPFVHPPPATVSSKKPSTTGGEPQSSSSLESSSLDPNEFNRELYDVAHLPSHRRAAFDDDSIQLNTPAVESDLASLSISHDDASVLSGGNNAQPTSASTSDELPQLKQRANVQQGEKLSRSQALDQAFFDQQNAVKGRVRRPFSYKYSEQGMAQQEVEKQRIQSNGKKHFKGNARKKVSAKGNSFMED